MTTIRRHLKLLRAAGFQTTPEPRGSLGDLDDMLRVAEGFFGETTAH